MMSEKNRIHYFRTALLLQGISMSEQMADQVIQTYDKLNELGGSFSLKDAAEIEAGIQEKYKSNA